MKKILALICAVLLCVGLTACGEQPKESKTLTTDNLDAYITVEAQVSDITRYSVYNGATGTTETGFKSCVITVNASAKEGVTAENVTLTFNLVPSEQRFKTVSGETLTLSADGSAVGTYEYADKQKGDNPVFSVIITDVSGTVLQ